MPPSVGPSTSPSGVPHCYRHPGRETYIRCQRCERHVCPECMRDAAVGFQCPECVARGAKETRSGRALLGGRRSENPQATSLGLAGVNLVIWVAVLVTGGATSWLADRLMLSPLGRCVVGDGSQWYPNVDGAGLCATLPGASWQSGLADGAWWQVLTHGFVHVDLWHLALNAVGLMILGPPVEQAMGRLRFLALYLLATLTAGATIFVFAPPYSATLGASGGVFGLMGALLVLSVRFRGDVRGLVTLLVLNAVITFAVPGISWQGHLGGFVGGALAAAVLVYAPRGERRSLWQWLGFALIAVVVLAVFVARALALR
ncbi:rhomboid family intramembrane serine protease [Nocardioides sp. Y6]|uniref:Rhomboid family intramembrane serine protease n=1 Tax=Nocardioides malaquae TaxID=2773426 RepID=A0ABR9RWL0_9ACTN|nr:rhomboid family intramembrane serine protease [Nocardioides malaquae]